MANHSFNHLWLIGPQDALQRWQSPDAWAALGFRIDWFGLFHPEHGYPVGQVGTFVTNRCPISVVDTERRAGIAQELDQFLAYADEAWLEAGHEWCWRDGTVLPRTPRFPPRHSPGASPDPTVPDPEAWVAHQAQVWADVALERCRALPIPVADTGLPLLLRRALWRDDAHAVRELLDAGLAPRTTTDWWNGVRDAVRARAWPLAGWPTSRADGEGGQALRAWLEAMPAANRTHQDALRLSTWLNTPGTDAGVKAALQAWVPADPVWRMTGLGLPLPQHPHDPVAEAGVLRLWRATSADRQRLLLDEWCGELRQIAARVDGRVQPLESRVVGLMQRLAEVSGDAVLQPLVPDLVQNGWSRLGIWLETRLLRGELPPEGLPTVHGSRSRARL